MRLSQLCLLLLCASGTEPPRAAPGDAAGRGGAGAARVEPRQAWMLLAGSPGRGSGHRENPGSPGKASSAAGRTGAAPASPAMPEELLRELQLLLTGVAGMCRTAGAGWKEEESSKGSLQAGAQRRGEAAFQCQTREDIPVEHKMWQELGPFYIPEREGMFHRGPGLNLTSGQYTAPTAGYYTFTSSLPIALREPRRKGRGWRGSRLRVLSCVRSLCRHNGNLQPVSRLESSGDLLTISVTGTLHLQAGQYASGFVDNTAGSPLTVQSGSRFSAVLLGV